NGRCRACQIVDLINLNIERERHVVTHQLESLAVEQVFDISSGSGKEIVDADHIGTVLKEALRKMGAEKSGATGDQNPCFQMHYQTLSVGTGISILIATANHSFPLVDIVEPEDVVLAEITSGLHLDQLQRNFAGVGEPVH